jgi:hypothetical protein
MVPPEFLYAAQHSQWETDSRADVLWPLSLTPNLPEAVLADASLWASTSIAFASDSFLQSHAPAEFLRYPEFPFGSRAHSLVITSASAKDPLLGREAGGLIVSTVLDGRFDPAVAGRVLVAQIERPDFLILSHTARTLREVVAAGPDPSLAVRDLLLTTLAELETGGESTGFSKLLEVLLEACKNAPPPAGHLGIQKLAALTMNKSATTVARRVLKTVGAA